jgi:uncharacterized membrane protein HdeD (DUF308 family)
MTTTSAEPVSHNQQSSPGINWIVLLVLGLLAAGLGIFLLLQPLSAARLLIQGIGIYWLIAGLVELVGAFVDRKAPMRLLRMIGAFAAVLSGGLVLLSMIIGQAIAPGLTRIIVAITALVLGVLNIAIGLDRSAPARGRLIIGVVYALLGIVLLVDPAVVPSFVLPLIGLLFLVAGGYAVYLAVQGRQAGSVVLGSPGSPSPDVQKQAMLDQARDDVDRIAQQAKDSGVGPRDDS